MPDGPVGLLVGNLVPSNSLHSQLSLIVGEQPSSRARLGGRKVWQNKDGQDTDDKGSNAFEKKQPSPSTETSSVRQASKDARSQ